MILGALQYVKMEFFINLEDGLQIWRIVRIVNDTNGMEYISYFYLILAV